MLQKDIQGVPRALQKDPNMSPNPPPPTPAQWSMITSKVNPLQNLVTKGQHLSDPRIYSEFPHRNPSVTKVTPEYIFDPLVTSKMTQKLS